MKFNIGDKIVCITNKWEQEVGEKPFIKPIKNLTYTVKGYSILHPICLILNEIPKVQNGWIYVWNEAKFALLEEYLNEEEEQMVARIIEEITEPKLQPV